MQGMTCTTLDRNKGGIRTASLLSKMKIHSSCEIEDFVETHLRKLCVISDRAHYELCVLIKDRRLPLQLQCSYQGQQGDFSQSVRGNYKTRF